jgi:ATP-binding cassette subfamily C (CFTR/MRP) protein 1
MERIKDDLQQIADSLDEEAKAVDVMSSTIELITIDSANKTSSKTGDVEKGEAEQASFTKLMTIEERNLGKVSWKVYSYYIYAGGIGYVALLVFSLLSAQVAQIVAQFHLAAWGQRAADTPGGLSSNENLKELQRYAWLSCLTLIFITTRAIAFAEHRIGTSAKLHGDLLERILGAPIAFFDVTPMGRILNRFSSDMFTADEELSSTISALSNAGSQLLGSLAAVIGATKGIFLILMIPLVAVYVRIQTVFRRTNTAIARIESITRSPIYVDFSETLAGVQSIRAHKSQSHFIDVLEERVNSNSIAGESFSIYLLYNIVCLS